MNMTAAGAFEFVSYKQFSENMRSSFGNLPEEEIKASYGRLKKPVRATGGSAGYDFYATRDITLSPGEEIVVPTGLRVRMRSDFALLIFPRSGLGFRYRIQLSNTVGIIDSDYYGAKNEGHILIKIANDSFEGRTLSLKEGDAFAQGVFFIYGITEDDKAAGIRLGGFGSTG